MSRFLATLRITSRIAATRVTPRSLPVASILRSTPVAFLHSSRRTFADAAPTSSLQQNEVQERVLNVVKGFEKIKDASKVTATSTFGGDLGLDSLDAVEVVMAFEDEFGIEIPDADADKIQSTADAIKYIAAHPKAQ